MLENLKQAFYAGVGMVHMTTEKAKEIGEKLAKETGVTEQEGKKFIDEIVKKSGEAKVAMEQMVKKQVESTLKALNVPNKEEIDGLKRRIDVLEKELSSRE